MTPHRRAQIIYIVWLLFLTGICIAYFFGYRGNLIDLLIGSVISLICFEIRRILTD